MQADFEVLRVSEKQSQTKTQTAKGLAFEVVVNSEVVMLYVKWPTITRRRDRWRVVRLLLLAVVGGE